MNDRKRTKEPAAWKMWLFPRMIREYWVDLVVMNILFVITCLPIITIPAAMMCQCSLIYKMQKDETVRIIRDYFKEFCKMFPRSFRPGCWAVIGLGLCAVCLICLEYVVDLSMAATVAVLLVLMLLVYGVFSLCQYLFPLSAILDLPADVIFRNALILSLSEAGANVSSLICILVLNLLVVVTSPYTLPVYVVIHFSLWALISMCFGAKGIGKCIL